MARTTAESHRGEELDAVAGSSLVLIARGASHGYDVARHFASNGLLGSVLTLSRPVVYRAIKLLESKGLVVSSESVGVRGQLKWTLTCTPLGRRTAEAWLKSPVEHLREMRTEFLLRFLLLESAGADTAGFIRSQRNALEEVTSGLIAGQSRDAVALWRREQARAALRFLDELESGTSLRDGSAAPPVNLSARNQLRATVVSVKHGDILSSVRLDVEAGQSMTSTITHEATDALRLAPGTKVIALCKATDVMIAVDQSTIA